MLDVYTNLWEWTATDNLGKSRTYQTAISQGHTEAAVLEHLRGHYRNLTITSIKEITTRDIKPATGTVERHTFTFGIIDEIEALLRPQVRQRLGTSMLEFQKLVRLNKKRQAVELGVEIQKQFNAEAEAAQGALQPTGRSILGAGRSLIKRA